MPQRNRWMAIRPKSSPLWLPVLGVCSTKEPVSLPLPLEHSKTNAAELRYGYSSFMYEPSITAIQELSAIEAAIQPRSPMMDRLSHIQVLPQPLMTYQKVVGEAWIGGRGECKKMLLTASATSFIERILP
jgi:hypothetical protein